MSNFSIDALLGNVTFSKSSKNDTSKFIDRKSVEEEKKKDDDYKTRVENDDMNDKTEAAEYNEIEEFSSDSDVFSEKDYETTKGTFYCFLFNSNLTFVTFSLLIIQSFY